MGIVFKDDEPVECDCGCIVYSGWVTEATLTMMYRGKPKTIVYTHCNNEECAMKATYEQVSGYMDIEQYQVMDKADKENCYADQNECD